VVSAATELGRIIGGFLIATVPMRRLLVSGRIRVRLAHVPWLGGALGLLSALVVTTGRVAMPFFLAYGLRRGADIATEAVCALAMHVTRGAALVRFALLTRETVGLGVVLGGTMFAGSWVARRLLDRMSEGVFLALIEALLVVMGLPFLLVPR
jgi:hypothetical protein